MKIFADKRDEVDVLIIEGRIDGLSASEIRKVFDQEAADGQRFLVVDLKAVTFMSSAGLRVILQTHKSLSLIGGKLILVSVPPTVNEVFRLSGIDQFLHILPDGFPLRDFIQPEKQKENSATFEFQGIRFTSQAGSAARGSCFPIGSAEKLPVSSYDSKDVVKIQQSNIKFGAGLAVLGDDFADSKDFFGESVIIANHFFSFPAVKRPVVDYAYFSSESQNAVSFLHGFGFNGDFSVILHFEANGETPSLETLTNAARKVAGSGLFGMIVLGRSGGILGMNLRISPILDNKPSQGTIMDLDHFPKWLDFSLEEEDINKTLIAVGLVIKDDPGTVSPSLKNIFPVEAEMHFHAAIFENQLISQKVSEFSSELERICREFEVEKVIHLLPVSKIKSGFVGIVNLDNYGWKSGSER